MKLSVDILISLKGIIMKFRSLKVKPKIVITSILILLVISTSTVTTILVLKNIKDSNLQVEFFPKSMKSCPDHKAWLLAKVTSDNSNLNDSFAIQIEANTTVDLDYCLWNKTTNIRFMEIFVYPEIEHIGLHIEIKLTITSGNMEVSDSALVTVVNWTLIDSSYAETLLEPFISYFSEEKLLYQIDQNTTWEGIASGIEIIVVSHFLFKSELWEIEISWHVMIAPYDWVKIYLRNRSDFSPIWAGKIDSWSSNHTIIEIDPPPEVYR